MGCHISNFFLSILFILWAFHLGPSPFFCTSADPCTCKGGGYEIYYDYCNLTQYLSTLNPALNKTLHSETTTEILAMKTRAQSSFQSQEAFGGRYVLWCDQYSQHSVIRTLSESKWTDNATSPRAA